MWWWMIVMLAGLLVGCGSQVRVETPSTAQVSATEETLKRQLMAQEERTAKVLTELEEQQEKFFGVIRRGTDQLLNPEATNSPYLRVPQANGRLSIEERAQKLKEAWNRAERLLTRRLDLKAKMDRNIQELLELQRALLSLQADAAQRFLEEFEKLKKKLDAPKENPKGEQKWRT